MPKIAILRNKLIGRELLMWGGGDDKIIVNFLKKSLKIFWKFRKMLYLCTRFQSNGEIAQLVRAHDS